MIHPDSQSRARSSSRLVLRPTNCAGFPLCSFFLLVPGASGSSLPGACPELEVGLCTGVCAGSLPCAQAPPIVTNTYTSKCQALPCAPRALCVKAFDFDLDVPTTKTPNAKLPQMPSLYNRVAGQNVERLAALSDGIFAVAMTLLVLDLRVPAAQAVHSEPDLRRALIALSPRIVVFLMSIMTLGIFWVGQQTQLNHFARSDRNLAWIHIAFLCAVSLTPFSTALLAEFIHYRTALLVYWSNILLLGLTLFWSWSYATRAHLLVDDLPEEVHPAVIRRIVIAQSLYAAGAALCVINTYYSIAAIVLVQLNYAIAPRFWWGLFSRNHAED